MKPVFIFLFTLNCLPVLAQETIINDKNAELRSVRDFTGIKISGGIDIFLSQSDGYAVAVSAIDSKYRDNIVTEVKNGILVIYYNNDRFRLASGDKKLKAYISFKTLESLEASGACDVNITGSLNGNSLLIKLSGACDIEGAIKINDLALNLSGASTVDLRGSAENISITASGASDVKNYDLVTQNCVAKLSGASDVKITVNNSISGSASGASTLHYEGNPAKKDVVTSGASSVSQKNR